MTTATSEAVARTVATNETAVPHELVTMTVTKNAMMATNTSVEDVSECTVEQSVNVLVPQISGPNVEEVELFSWVQPRTDEQIVDVPVVMRVQESVIQKAQKTVQDPQVMHIDRIGDVPVVMRVQEHVIQKAQKTVQDPQVTYIDRIGDSPVVMGVQEPVIQGVQKTVRDLRAAYVDRIGDSPAVLRRCEAAKNQKMSDVSGTQQNDYATSSMASAIHGGRDLAQTLTTLKRETAGTMDGDGTDENAEREGKGDWRHLYGPEYCSECGQIPFECGCLNVDFESNNAWWIKAGSRVNSVGKRRVSRAVRQVMSG